MNVTTDWKLNIIRHKISAGDEYQWPQTGMATMNFETDTTDGLNLTIAIGIIKEVYNAQKKFLFCFLNTLVKL